MSQLPAWFCLAGLASAACSQSQGNNELPAGAVTASGTPSNSASTASASGAASVAPLASATGGVAPGTSGSSTSAPPSTSTVHSTSTVNTAPMVSSASVASASSTTPAATGSVPAALESASAQASSAPEASATLTPPSPGVPAVHYVGRYELDGSSARFAWSGSGVVAAFDGTALSIRLEDGGSNQFTVLIDGNLQPVLKTQSGSQLYALVSDLADEPHVVEVYRRTEASFGVTTFEGFEFGADGELLAPPQPLTRHIEFVGDSITCGYGDEGTVPTCGFSADTENHYLTYAALAARELQAEASTVAWSGKGIIYNYDTDTNNPLPTLYDRVLPEDAGSAWDFSTPADAVVVNLGTNDFSTEGDPSLELFRDAYVALLERIREVYPGAFILCTVGPLLSGADLDAARAGIAAAVQVRTDAGDPDLAAWEMNISNDAPGCDYHPSLGTHQLMANALVTELKQHLDW